MSEQDWKSRIKIRDDFRDLIPKLGDAELEQLHRSLCALGCRDPLVVWKGRDVLLDGHHRFKYCVEHGAEFRVVELACSDEDAARNFIILNQLGRRNLNARAAKILRGKLYMGRKKEHGGDRKSATVKSSGSSCHMKTEEQVAKETGVSPRTVRNDAAFAAAADAIGATAGIIAGTDKRAEKEIVEEAKKRSPKRTRKSSNAAGPKWRLTVDKLSKSIVSALGKLKGEDLTSAIEELHALLERSRA